MLNILIYYLFYLLNTFEWTFFLLPDKVYRTFLCTKYFYLDFFIPELLVFCHLPFPRHILLLLLYMLCIHLSNFDCLIPKRAFTRIVITHNNDYCTVILYLMYWWRLNTLLSALSIAYANGSVLHAGLLNKIYTHYHVWFSNRFP